MTLFVSKRALNTGDDRFSNNISTITRYVAITGKKPGGKWSAHVIEADEFVAKAKAEARSDDVLIYVHGFNTKQKTMLKRHKFLEDGLGKFGYKGAVVSFDWPSEGRGGLGAYKSDLETKASKMGSFLAADIIKMFRTSSWAPRVHLIGHSMGAFVIQEGFGKLASGSQKAVEQVMLVSGDAHKRDFRAGRPEAKRIARNSRQLTNYYSTADEILSLATVYHGSKRVGQSGMPKTTETGHVNVYSTARYRKIKPDFDVHFDGALFSHGWWFEDDRFLEDAARVLKGETGALPTRRVTNLGTPALRP